MKNKSEHTGADGELRQRAEKIAGVSPNDPADNQEAMLSKEGRQTVHELRVHEIELEMQNEELRRREAELEASRAHYFNFYDTAPVGYVTVNAQGLILDTNLTFSTMLGAERRALEKMSFAQCIADEDRDGNYLQRKQLFDTRGHSTSDLRMIKKNGTLFWVRLDANVVNDVDNKPVCRIVVSDITERKKAEEALEKSEQNYRTLVDSGQALIWLAGTDKLCYYFNRVWLEFTGRTLEQEMGNGWAEGVHADDLQRCLGIYVSAFDRRKKFNMEYRLRRFDGEYRWILDDGCPRYNSTGEFVGYIGHCLDVTERKDAEEALKESELFARSTLDALSAHIAIVNELGDIEAVNKAWKDFAAANGAGWHCVSEGSNYLNVCRQSSGKDAEGALEFAEEIGKVLAGKNEEFEMEYPCHSPTEQRWFTVRVTRFPGEGRRRAVVAHENITKRKLAEHLVREHDLQFRKLSANVPDLIFQFTRKPDGTYFVPIASVGIKNIFGCSPEDVLNDFTPISRVIYPEDAARVISDIEYSAAHLTYFTCEFRVHIPGRKIQWIYSRSAPEKLADGSITWYGFNTDITERKLAEEKLREIETRLRQSEKMEAVGQLAGGIAHDFNNVLGGIIGFTDISLAYAEKGSILERNLSNVLKAADRAKNLVKQILAFSRKGNPQKSITVLRPIIQEVLDLLKHSIPSSVFIEAELQSTSKPVLADPTQIHQALLNLATNAVHAMNRKGKLSVRLSSRVIDTVEHGRSGDIVPGEYAVIEVADTGCGMDPVTLSKAFEPFYTTKPVGEGTGMGLSVVLGIVQSHGGDLQVESAIGEGTTIRMLLPITEETISGSINDNQHPAGSGTERILFVDDEELLVELNLNSLTVLGYRVTAVSNSRDALTVLREKSTGIDVLITDQTMPEMTGIELAREALLIRKDLPIILCTGFSNEINREQAAAIGIRKFIMKPYRTLEISKAIRDVLDEKV